MELRKRAFAAILLLSASFALADGAVDVSASLGPAGEARVAGKLPVRKSGHTATQLHDGNVFIYGADQFNLTGSVGHRLQQLQEGRPRNSSGPYVQEPLVWDAGTRIWKKIAKPPQCAYTQTLHTATALPDGKVLIAGGVCDVPQAANERHPLEPHLALAVWDARTQKWLDNVPSLSTSRIFHSATALKDGSVLIAGGQSDPILPARSDRGPVLGDIERYADGRIERLPPLATPRAAHAATLLADGTLLISGGYDARMQSLNSVELYDPTSRRWSALPPMRQARHSHSATLLADGRLLVAGGESRKGVPLASVELFDPSTRQWSSAAPLLLPRASHSALLLSSGDVLIAGGLTLDDKPADAAILWDRATAQWRPAGSRDGTLWTRLNAHPLPLLSRPDGSAYALGQETILQWRQGAGIAGETSPQLERTAFSATPLADGRILIAGGRSGNAFLDWTEVPDPKSGQFAPSGRLGVARSNHQAVLLDDGRVVVAGGWTRTPDEPVEAAANVPEVWDPETNRWSPLRDIRFEWQDSVHLARLSTGQVLFFASRELARDDEEAPLGYRAWLWSPRTGQTQVRNVSVTPRARAAIAILPDGRVLLVGGDARDPAGELHAYHGAELWDSGSDSRRNLALPRDWYAATPSSLVLRNGNVVLTSREPVNPRWADRPAAPIWLLDVGDGRWSRLPALPEHLSWPIVELSDGTLATKRHRLAPGAQTWIAGPVLPQEDAQLIPLPGTRLMSLSTRFPFTAEVGAGADAWTFPPTSDIPPWWLLRPAAVALADGRLAVVGITESGIGATSSSWLWSPSDNLWRRNGFLQRHYQNGRMLQLQSGRVMHIGTVQSQMVCESRHPRDANWSFCGSFTAAPSHFTLATLEDGRAALLASTDSLFVFDEDRLAWTKMKLELAKPKPLFGAPVPRGDVMARAFNEDTGDRLDASIIYAKYWEQARLYGDQPRMLWDPSKKQWAYVFLATAEGIGPGASFLPDGCALSGPPYRTFNPASGQVAAAEDFSQTDWFGGDAVSAVLVDGTAVVLGITAPDEDGARFRHARFSCSGWSGSRDYALIPPTFVRKAAPSTEAPMRRAVSRSERLAALHIDPMLVLAIAGPLLAYLLLRRLATPGRRLLDRLNDSHLGRINIPLPAFTSTVVRIVFYTIAAMIIVPQLLGYVAVTSILEGDACRTRAAHCLDESTGILKAVRLPGAWLRGTPSIPCRFVGIWSSIHGQRVHRITLTGDGRYNGFSSIRGIEPLDHYAGYWSVQRGFMIWRSDRPGKHDINRIAEESDKQFTLIESDGESTRFELIERGAPARCTQ